MDVYAFLSALIFAAAPEWGFMCFVSIRCYDTLIYPSPRVFSGGVSVTLCVFDKYGYASRRNGTNIRIYSIF